MALIKFGGGITEMRGSIAGNTYARNRYGAYARSRTVPVNPNSANQQQVRNIIAFLCQAWSQALTAAQRTAWGLYADNVAMLNKLGESMYLTGFNHYIRSNTARLQAGLTRVDAGPTIFEIPEKDSTIVDTISEATQEHSLVFDDTMNWVDEDDAGLIVRMGQPQNAQRNFFNGPFRYNFVIEGDSVSAPTSPQTNAVEFAVTEGQHIWIACRISRADGRLSETFRADTFCTA